MIKIISVIIFTVAALSLTLRPDRSVINKPIIEDSFYSFTVARNIAQGKGVTIDGSIPTNGFQPLFTFLCIPFFFFTSGNDYAAIRYILILQWVFFIASAYFLGKIARDAFYVQHPQQASVIKWSTWFIYLSSLYIFMNHFNGLETGCVLFLYILAWRYFQTGEIDRWSGAVKLGLILGFLVLTRIDAVFLVAVVLLYEMFFNRKKKLSVRLGRSTVIGAAAFLISSPWWIYNLIIFSTLMPSSGSAQQSFALSFTRAGGALSAVCQAAVPQVYLSRFEYYFWQGKLGANLIRGGVSLGVLALCFKHRAEIKELLRGREFSTHTLERAIIFSGCLLVATLGMVLWYTISSWAVHFYARYFSPIFLISTVVFAYIITRLSDRRPKFSYAIFAIIALPFLISIGLIHAERGFSGNKNYSQQLQLVNAIVPEGDLVSAGQSATLGFFRDHVINLDGKVNAEALAFQEKMPEYLRINGIRWICDWPSYVSHYLGDSPQSLGWQWIAERGSFVLYHYDE